MMRSSESILAKLISFLKLSIQRAGELGGRVDSSSQKGFAVARRYFDSHSFTENAV